MCMCVIFLVYFFCLVYLVESMVRVTRLLAMFVCCTFTTNDHVNRERESVIYCCVVLIIIKKKKKRETAIIAVV